MNEKYLISTFARGRFSAGLQKQFGWWLLNNGEQERCEREMEEIWEECGEQSLPTDTTLSDLRSVMAQIGGTTAPARPRRRMTGVMWAAAATVALIICSAVTFLLSRNYFYAERAAQEFAQVTVPNGEIRRIELPDGSHVTLNAGSTLIYPLRFLSDSRSVFLSGCANFEVIRHDKLPFIVKSQHLAVTVLGTTFNVNSYPESNTVTTTLVSGSVRVTTIDAEGKPSEDNAYTLSPDERLTYDKLTNSVKIESVNAPEDMAWEDGFMTFNGSNFADILDALRRRFNISIQCSEIHKMTGTYHVHFKPEEKLEDVLWVINYLGNHFTYTIQGNTLYIRPE